MAGTFIYHVKVNHAANKTHLIFASKTVPDGGEAGRRTPSTPSVLSSSEEWQLHKRSHENNKCIQTRGNPPGKRKQRVAGDRASSLNARTPESGGLFSKSGSTFIGCHLERDAYLL